MATKSRESKLHWYLPFVLSLVLTTLGTASAASDINPSSYAPEVGAQFYLLSESTFSSNEIAKVRLESNNETALNSYGGADIRVYRIPDPLNFLKKQKNLHRPQLEGAYNPSEVGNALKYIWDSWYKKSRLAWQRILKADLRKKTVEKLPDLKQVPPFTYNTQFDNNPQFKPVAGLELVNQFRYPVLSSKPIQPPPGAKVDGSTIRVSPGNVYIPLGKQQPGLYLVEAMIGTFRATNFLFVSDTVAISKVSSNEELVWTADKTTGDVSPGTRLLLSDGVGILKEGISDRNGFLEFDRRKLEKSYILGQDSKGGVFISENYYYDSEIYNNKFYVYTDRPLYRPGDTVRVKVFARNFVDSQTSRAVSASNIEIVALDANGTRLYQGKLPFDTSANGTDISFEIPEEALPGGYTLQAIYNKTVYTSAFRVNNFVKPHFQMEINFDKANYKTKEAIRGELLLTYGNGKPVGNAFADIVIRKQRLSIMEGEIRNLDRFPIEVAKKTLQSDSDGKVKIDIPPVDEPSRIIIFAKAADQSSYRVNFTKEILVQVVQNPISFKTSKNFSKVDESVDFTIQSASTLANDKKMWKAVRLEDQSSNQGEVDPQSKIFKIKFAKAGSYTVYLMNSSEVILGSSSHTVLGPELKTTPGTISIILDKDEYEIGETANAVISFPNPVKNALVTLELDKVEFKTLINQSENWIKLEQTTDREFLAQIPITHKHSPNITLSVAYLWEGEYFFENKGLKVKKPSIEVSLKSDKTTYLPGEKVTVEIETSFQGKAMESMVALGVVDEMIYVLQPEIAPDIFDFFFHPRRNQVRTSSSLNFHSYDVSVSATGALANSGSSEYSERNFKTRERPRRDDKDTAAWIPNIKTDANGKAVFRFFMPDSLTRWRITAKAMSSDGEVGQKTAYIQSSKELYMKWTSATSYREGDKPKAQIAVFNETGSKKSAILEVTGSKDVIKRDLELTPGINYVVFPFAIDKSADLNLVIRSKEDKIDQLIIPIEIFPLQWPAFKSVLVTPTTLLPEDSRRIRLGIAAPGSDVFLSMADSLLEIPCGCGEQLSTRIISLALVLANVKNFGIEASMEEKLARRLLSERQRLIKLAGPGAKFSWWGGISQDSLFLTGYAFYADWLATKALDITLPKSHWEHPLNMYATEASKETYLNRLLFVWMANEMGLPTKTLVEGLVENMKEGLAPGQYTELFLEDSEFYQDLDLLMVKSLADQNKIDFPKDFQDRLSDSKARAEKSKDFRTLIMIADRSGKNASQSDLDLTKEILFKNRMAYGGPDNAMSLVLAEKILSQSKDLVVEVPSPDLGPDWIRSSSDLGRSIWSLRNTKSHPVLSTLPTLPNGFSYRLSYDTMEISKNDLAVDINRKLYRLVQKDSDLKYMAVEVKKPWKLDPKDLYLESIKLKPKTGSTISFGLLEVPMFAGSHIETTTWGIRVEDESGKVMDIDATGLESKSNAYTRPFESLSDEITVNQLIRYSQSGSYETPSARFYQMYNPTQKAYEQDKNSMHQTVTVD